jgi:hypothetical protein
LVRELRLVAAPQPLWLKDHARLRILAVHYQTGESSTMKTVSIALVSASVLALAACGGGSKGNNSSNASNSSSATEQLNTTSPLPPPGDLVNGTNTLNSTGPVETNTLTTTGNTVGNTSGNLSLSGNNSSAANNSTTK